MATVGMKQQGSYRWCNKKFSGRESELDKFFEENGLTENVDYLE
jgi:hypothetical protein